MFWAKKLVLALTTSALVVGASKKAEDEAGGIAVALKKVLCIQYLIWFKTNDIQALLDSGSKVNAITSAFALKLDFQTWHTNIGAQKIDCSTV